MSKLLIVGGAGYVGSHTTHYLIENGFKKSDLIIFDNLVCGHRDFVPKGVNFIHGDLLSKSAIDRVFRANNIGAVIHFAAYAHVAESVKNPGKYFENNVTGGVNLLEAMLEGGCNKIIFSSTGATYGEPLKVPIKEDSVQIPTNPYGESKLMFEKILEWYSEIHGIRSVRLRYFNAAGAAFGIGEKHADETHLIPLVFRAATEGKSIKIYGDDYDTSDGTCVRDYIHVLDLASAHLKALDFLNTTDAKTIAFNLGTGKGVSVAEIINLAKKTCGKDIQIVVESRRPGDPSELVAHTGKAKKILGWKAQYNIKDILVDAWDWHREN